MLNGTFEKHASFYWAPNAEYMKFYDITLIIMIYINP